MFVALRIMCAMHFAEYTATSFGLHGSALILNTFKQGEPAIARAAFQQPNVKSMHVQAMQLQ